ncbi:4-hydroxybenzoate polyprenyltransferase-like prenyltransferase [Halovivax ruber XH-70]|uniref:4-hydroxybenzoate polyprenyltransferase-like prenyltransferase n=1 Tax=Halovivax ruber (strain DSM 18193 / JCM 13892 / XH-70) TaxID=797302 RepID=L0IAI8_HALRX|nr:prenyltransferase [Halovivax ruber]AGB15813.1 4-hydroxybenzoate polyprenyltransferase-like prenyltransferase [Halovivax ruber XH-70]
MSHVRRLLTRSRPLFWLYLAGPALVGAVYAADSPSTLTSPVVIGIVGYFLLPANLFLYGVNDVFDADVDAENPKKEGIEARYEGERLTIIAVVASAVVGLALIPVLSPPATYYLIGFLLLGAAYSVPPVRFKTRPLLDSVSNGLYVLPAGVTYATIAGTHPPALAVLGGWFWAMGMHTFSAIPDIDPDRRAEIRTTATVLGQPAALGYCVVCWALAAVTFGILDLRIGALLLVYPLIVGAIATANVTISRAYWWFPAVNSTVGMVLTLGGLWRVIYGS